MLHYLAGPMTGYPEFNYPRFDEVAKKLRELGLEVLSSHEVDHGETAETRGKTKPYQDYIREDLKSLLVCDAIVLLEGWTESTGATLEYRIARTLRIPIYQVCPHPDECAEYIHCIFPAGV